MFTIYIQIYQTVIYKNWMKKNKGAVASLNVICILSGVLACSDYMVMFIQAIKSINSLIASARMHSIRKSILLNSQTTKQSCIKSCILFYFFSFRMIILYSSCKQTKGAKKIVLLKWKYHKCSRFFFTFLRFCVSNYVLFQLGIYFSIIFTFWIWISTRF